MQGLGLGTGHMHPFLGGCVKAVNNPVVAKYHELCYQCERVLSKIDPMVEAVFFHPNFNAHKRVVTHVLEIIRVYANKVSSDQASHLFDSVVDMLINTPHTFPFELTEFMDAAVKQLLDHHVSILCGRNLRVGFELDACLKKRWVGGDVMWVGEAESPKEKEFRQYHYDTLHMTELIVATDLGINRWEWADKITAKIVYECLRNFRENPHPVKISYYKDTVGDITKHRQYATRMDEALVVLEKLVEPSKVEKLLSIVNE